MADQNSLKKNLLFSLICFVTFSGNVVAGDSSIEFPPFSPTSFSFYGASHADTVNNCVILTQDSPLKNFSSGLFFFNTPIPFQIPDNPIPASFKTYFSVRFENLNPSSLRVNVTLLLSPSIGDKVDFNSMIFITLVNLESIGGLSPQNGELVNIWVEYSGDNQQLDIFISVGEEKPELPFLSKTINLNKSMKEFMFIGFSGKTLGSNEVISVQRWTFISYYDAPTPPLTPPSPPESEANESPTKRGKSSRSKKKTNGTWMWILKAVAYVVGVSTLIISIQCCTGNTCFQNCCNCFNG